jgi:hypothetical protein
MLREEHRSRAEVACRQDDGAHYRVQVLVVGFQNTIATERGSYREHSAGRFKTIERQDVPCPSATYPSMAAAPAATGQHCASPQVATSSWTETGIERPALSMGECHINRSADALSWKNHSAPTASTRPASVTGNDWVSAYLIG